MTRMNWERARREYDLARSSDFASRADEADDRYFEREARYEAARTVRAAGSANASPAPGTKRGKKTRNLPKKKKNATSAQGSMPRAGGPVRFPGSSERGVATQAPSQMRARIDAVAEYWQATHGGTHQELKSFRRALSREAQLMKPSIKKDFKLVIGQARSAAGVVCLAVEHQERRLASKAQKSSSGTAKRSTASRDPATGTRARPRRGTKAGARSAQSENSRQKPKTKSPSSRPAQARCVHDIDRHHCPACGSNRKTVFISGGGMKFHLKRDCSALAEGQERVRRRGGEVSPIERVTPGSRRSAEVMRRNPCRTCVLPTIHKSLRS